MTSPPRGEGGSPKGDITLKGYSIKEVTRGRGGQKSQNGGDVIYERPLSKIIQPERLMENLVNKYIFITDDSIERVVRPLCISPHMSAIFLLW